MNHYVVVYHDGSIAVKFNRPPQELIQLGARVFEVGPNTSVGYLSWWMEAGYPIVKDIKEL